MIDWTLQLAFAALTISVALALYRLARGPTVIDRILAFDTIATCAVGMIVLLSIIRHTALYLELILIFTLLGFVGAVAYVYHQSCTGDLQPRTRSDAAPSSSTNPAPPHE